MLGTHDNQISITAANKIHIGSKFALGFDDAAFPPERGAAELSVNSGIPLQLSSSILGPSFCCIQRISRTGSIAKILNPIDITDAMAVGLCFINNYQVI